MLFTKCLFDLDIEVWGHVDEWYCALLNEHVRWSHISCVWSAYYWSIWWPSDQKGIYCHHDVIIKRSNFLIFTTSWLIDACPWWAIILLWFMRNDLVLMWGWLGYSLLWIWTNEKIKWWHVDFMSRLCLKWLMTRILSVLQGPWVLHEVFWLKCSLMIIDLNWSNSCHVVTIRKCAKFIFATSQHLNACLSEGPQY